MSAADFAEFIQFFPPLELPFSLLPDISQIPSDGKPLPGAMLDAYIYPFEGDEMDDVTEYIPFARIPDTKGFQALIYWKAGLMQYEFILATYTQEGEPLSHAIIGGLRSEEEGMLHSVAVVHDDLSITIAEGVDPMDLQHDGQPFDTQTYRMQLDPNGTIVYDTHEEKEES